MAKIFFCKLHQQFFFFHYPRAICEDGVLGVWSNDIIPKGTKFGPMVGDIYSPTDPLPQVRKYFWRVYDKTAGTIMFYIDGRDTSKSNWMRHVLPAYDTSAQNLVAFQVSQKRM